MNQFDKKSPPYRSLKITETLPKGHKSYLNPFTQRPSIKHSLHEVVEKTLNFRRTLTNYYNLYQLLLFHSGEEGMSFELIEENIRHTILKQFLRTFHKHKHIKIENTLMQNWKDQ